MERRKEPRIRLRFFGAKNKSIMVRSCISPDGTFVASGSESGSPFVWNFYLSFRQSQTRINTPKVLFAQGSVSAG